MPEEGLRCPGPGERVCAPSHRECCQQGAYDTVAREELNRVQGSYITGIVGALVGGLVGAIPTLLTSGFWKESGHFCTR